MPEDSPIGFGDRFEYKGKFYHYMREIKVKMRKDGKMAMKVESGEWVTCILYYNNTGYYGREKKEFLKRFTRCQS